jgi:hypothetical protein
VGSWFARRLDPQSLRERLAAAPPVPAATGDGTDDPDEQQVIGWLAQLRVLSGVPFNYLVPDAAMLPAGDPKQGHKGSIRFFQLDQAWVESLLDGAYSLGFAGVPGAGKAAAIEPGAPCSGFLLRSAVLTGWPGLRISAFADVGGTQPLQLLRGDRLAPTLLLSLYQGILARVDFQEPSEALHFGLDGTGPAWQKNLRYANGGPGTVGEFKPGATVPQVPMRPGGVLRAADLATAMKPDVWTQGTTDPPDFTAAEFGLEMVEGGELVSFQLQGKS